MGSPSSRFSFTMALLPGMSVLPWRHPLSGWMVCCMPPDHCVEILHLHHHRYRLCFDRRVHCHCLPSHSHPHCSLHHHCSLYRHRSLRHHCSLSHHWLKDCHPCFRLLACLGGYVSGLWGDLSLPLSAVHALGLAAAWPSPALVALVVSETPAVEFVDAAAVVPAAVRAAMVLTPRQPDLGPSPVVLAPPRVSKAASHLLRGQYPPALGQSLVRDRCLMLDPALVSTDLPPGRPPVESLLAVGFLCSSSPSWASVAWGLS